MGVGEQGNPLLHHFTDLIQVGLGSRMTGCKSEFVPHLNASWSWLSACFSGPGAKVGEALRQLLQLDLVEIRRQLQAPEPGLVQRVPGAGAEGAAGAPYVEVVAPQQGLAGVPRQELHAVARKDQAWRFRQLASQNDILYNSPRRPYAM